MSIELYLLGNKNENDKSNYPVTTMLQIDYEPFPKYNFVRFQNRAEKYSFLQKYFSIKDDIALQKNKLPEKKFKKWLRNKWLPKVNTFLQIYGSNRCPTDVRAALNDVKIGLGFDSVYFQEPIKFSSPNLQSVINNAENYVYV